MRVTQRLHMRFSTRSSKISDGGLLKELLSTRPPLFCYVYKCPYLLHLKVEFYNDRLTVFTEAIYNMNYSEILSALVFYMLEHQVIYAVKF